MKVYIVGTFEISEYNTYEVCATREIAEQYRAKRAAEDLEMWRRAGLSESASLFEVLEVEVLTEGPEA